MNAMFYRILVPERVFELNYNLGFNLTNDKFRWVR